MKSILVLAGLFGAMTAFAQNQVGVRADVTNVKDWMRSRVCVARNANEIAYAKHQWDSDVVWKDSPDLSRFEARVENNDVVLFVRTLYYECRYSSQMEDGTNPYFRDFDQKTQSWYYFPASPYSSLYEKEWHWVNVHGVTPYLFVKYANTQDLLSRAEIGWVAGQNNSEFAPGSSYAASRAYYKNRNYSDYTYRIPLNKILTSSDLATLARGQNVEKHTMVWTYINVGNRGPSASLRELNRMLNGRYRLRLTFMPQAQGQYTVVISYLGN